MKKRFILAMILMGCMLTSCTTSVSLDESNAEVVAEYVAELLVRYGSDTPDKLLVEEPFVRATALPTLQVTPTPSAPTTPSPTVKPVQTSTPTESNKAHTASPAPSEGIGKLTAHTKAVALSDIYGFKDVKVTLKGGQEYVSYPKNASAYCVTAQKGCKLLIVSFEAMNTGKDSVSFDLAKKDITYHLYVNGKWYSSLTSILENDAQFFNEKLNSQKSAEYLVAFEVEENLNTENAELVLLQDKNSCELKLK